MYIHSITPYSRVNGPGKRTVIHFQGCTLNCAGCFNSHTHQTSPQYKTTLEQVLPRIPTDIDGVTISGGEPFLQPQALLELILELKKRSLSVVVFSGFYIKEIKNIPLGKKILSLIDVLIDGRFEQEHVSIDGLRGSNNQTIHLLSSRYTLDELLGRNTELIFDEKGNIEFHGFPNEQWLTSVFR